MTSPPPTSYFTFFRMEIPFHMYPEGQMRAELTSKEAMEGCFKKWHNSARTGACWNESGSCMIIRMSDLEGKRMDINIIALLDPSSGRAFMDFTRLEGCPFTFRRLCYMLLQEVQEFVKEEGLHEKFLVAWRKEQVFHNGHVEFESQS